MATLALMRHVFRLFLIAAVLLGLLGAFFGYASAEHYGWVFRLWLFLSSTSAILLTVVIARALRDTKVIAAALLAPVILAGIEPAYRLAHVGLFSP